MADSKKYDGSQWEHSLRKFTTATEAVENPLYSDGTAITAYTLKGNTVQNGTPTPSNPVEVNGVGERTENLLPINNRILNPSNWSNANYYYIRYSLRSLLNLPNGKVTMSVFLSGDAITNRPFGFTKTYDGTLPQEERNVDYTGQVVRKNVVLQLESNDDVYIAIGDTSGITTEAKQQEAIDKIFGNYQIMITIGENNPSVFEPYGYKIPISSGGVTTNIYLSEPLYKIGDYADTIAADGTVTRNIKKLVLTGAEDYDIQTVNTYGIVNFRTPVGFLSDRLPAEGMAVCTHFELQTSNISTEQSEGFRTIESNRMYLRVSNARYGTVVAFQQYLADQYSAGTPVTVWYVLETPTTETTTTSAIPTTEGANSITVDTTVQPSEFTATWTGWHNAEVKEYDGSDWQ